MASNIRLSGSQTSARSESDVRFNPNNLNQIIGASNNLSFNPQAQFYSSDGGATWSQTYLPAVAGDSNQSDPSVDWTSDGTAWALTVGVAGNQVVRAFKSTDGGATWTFDNTISGTQTNVDKPNLWVDHSATSPYKDNLYALWWNSGPTYVARRPGPSGTWQTPLQVSGAETTGSSDGGDIKTNTFGDVFAFWPSESDQKLFVAKSTDGGVSFTALGAPVKIADTFSSFLYHVPADEPSRGALLYITGGAYRTATADMVYALWMDLAGGTGCNSTANEPGTDVTSACTTRIWFSRSSDGGAHWDAPKKINDQTSKNDQFFPRLAVDQTTGAMMVVYYDTVGDSGRKKTDVWMQFSTDSGASWSGATRVTTAQTDETAAGANTYQYGDYIGLTGQSGRFFACWTDRRGGSSEEIWGAPLAIPTCELRVNKSTFGQDEVAATSNFAPAFWLAVDGFFHEALGFNNTADLNSSPTLLPTITATIEASLNPGLTAAQIATIAANLPTVNQLGPLPIIAEDPTLQQALQTFLYPYTISFSGGAAFNALNQHQSAIITLNASFTVGSVTVTSSATIELAKGEDPYFRDVDISNPTQPSWLSFDLRFFKMTQDQPHQMFNVPNISDASAAPGYIAQVIQNLNTPGANLNGDSFDGLNQNEDQSALEFHQTDDNNKLVFNFALARVRLVGNTTTTVTPVRVFFRLFQAQTTASDFNENTTYRFGTDGAINGHKIATLGVQNDANGNPEYVTIPCFAAPRVNLGAPADMKTQTDPANARTVTTNPGQNVYTYFGCWLDVNQPQQQFLIPTPPANSSLWDGPWSGTQSVSGAISVAPHQCLIAEIRFDDTPIPPGATSANSDKLAQRNIAWLHGPNPGVESSRRTPHPFETRATPPSATEPDDLMITWGATPSGSTASLYMPEILASDVMKLADATYASHRLVATDVHTIQCPVGGATYIPLPRGTARNAGLLTVDLPVGVRRGDVYDIIVRQFTEAAARRVDVPQPPIITASKAGERFAWRRVLGAFQITIRISTKGELLFPEERLLAWLKWRLDATPVTHRWYPVLRRYLEQVDGRVLGFGGDPSKVFPSPTGPLHHPKPGRTSPGSHQVEFVGKISGIVYDRFGDFEGFFLLTEEGHEKSFRGREDEIENVVHRAWRERIVVAVLVDGHEPHWPTAIVLRRAPRQTRQ